MNNNFDYSNTDKLNEYYFSKNNIVPSSFLGDVLYVGMGSGYGARNQSKKVKSTTFVEIDQNIINEFHVNKDWKVIKGDAYKIDLKDKYDVIFLDIFIKYTPKKEFYKLINLYSKNLKDDGIMIYIKTLMY